jgi:hypothetical protein
MAHRFDDLKRLWPLGLVAFLILVTGYAGYWPAVPLAQPSKGRPKFLSDDPKRVRVEWLVKTLSADAAESPVSGYVVADHRVVSAPGWRPLSAAGGGLEVGADPSRVLAAADSAVQTQPHLMRVGERFFCVWQFHPTHLHGAGQSILGAWSDNGLDWEAPVEVFGSPQPVGGYRTGDRLFCVSSCLMAEGQAYAVASLQEVVGFGSIDATTFESAIAVVGSPEFPRPVRKILGYVVRRVHADGRLGPTRWIGQTDGTAGSGARGPWEQFGDGELPEAADLPLAADLAVAEPLGDVERAALGSLTRQLATPESRWGGRVEFPIPERVTPDRYRLSFPTLVNLPGVGQVRLWSSEQGLDRLYSEQSTDGGQTWSAPMPTNLRNGGRFAVLQRLAVGPILLVGNQSRLPVNVADPLTISIAFEGLQFTESFDLRSGAPLLADADELPEFARNERRGFQATSCFADDQWFWVVYSVSGSSIELSRVSLLDLIPSIREQDSAEEPGAN